MSEMIPDTKKAPFPGLSSTLNRAWSSAAELVGHLPDQAIGRQG
jgi:hypothetical protein